MPTYVYKLKVVTKDKGCEYCRESFEIVQKMSEDSLTKCPHCSAEIEKVIQAPMLGDAAKLKGPTSKQLSNAGFTQYKRKGKGYYEKQFGTGPSSLGGSGQF